MNASNSYPENIFAVREWNTLLSSKIYFKKTTNQLLLLTWYCICFLRNSFKNSFSCFSIDLIENFYESSFKYSVQDLCRNTLKKNQWEFLKKIMLKVFQRILHLINTIENSSKSGIS